MLYGEAGDGVGALQLEIPRNGVSFHCLCGPESPEHNRPSGTPGLTCGLGPNTWVVPAILWTLDKCLTNGDIMKGDEALQSTEGKDTLGFLGGVTLSGLFEIARATDWVAFLNLLLQSWRLEV